MDNHNANLERECDNKYHTRVNNNDNDKNSIGHSRNIHIYTYFRKDLEDKSLHYNISTQVFTDSQYQKNFGYRTSNV